MELEGWQGTVQWDHWCPCPHRVASNLDESLKGQYKVTVEAEDGEEPVHRAQTVLSVSVTPKPCPRTPPPQASSAHPWSPHTDLHGGSELPHSAPVLDNGGRSPE